MFTKVPYQISAQLISVCVVSDCTHSVLLINRMHIQIRLLVSFRILNCICWFLLNFFVSFSILSFPLTQISPILKPLCYLTLSRWLKFQHFFFSPPPFFFFFCLNNVCPTLWSEVPQWAFLSRCQVLDSASRKKYIFLLLPWKHRSVMPLPLLSCPPSHPLFFFCLFLPLAPPPVFVWCPDH